MFLTNCIVHGGLIQILTRFHFEGNIILILHIFILYNGDMLMTLPKNVKLRLLMLFIQNASVNAVFPFMALLLTHYLGGKKPDLCSLLGFY